MRDGSGSTVVAPRPFRMPALGADMEHGTIVEWRVAPGDTVRRGQIVAVVDTEKATIEVEIFDDGVIDELVVPVGEQVPIGTVLATLRAGTESAPSGPAPSGPAPTPPVAPPVAPPPPSPGGGGGAAVRGPLASPVARRLAASLGVDLATVRGTGHGGEVTRHDVEAAAPPRGEESPREAPRSLPATPRGEQPPRESPRILPAASPFARRRAAELGVDLRAVEGTGPGGAVTAGDVARSLVTPAHAAAPVAPAPPAEPAPAVDRAASMRRAIAALMARSKREIPHYYLSTTVDLAAALGWLEQANLARPVQKRLLPAVLLLKATALAAREHPALNGFWLDDGFRPGTGVHLGVAVSLRQGGLVAPAIHDADTLPVDDLAAALLDLVARARAGRLRSSEMADPTITVTNLGDQGVESVHGVIYPPQVALVGFGRIAERPWAVDGMLGVRPVVVATLAGDHRATDGHRGARFLSTVDRLLQHPGEL